MLRKDTLVLGILLGLLAPFIGMFVYYYFAFYTRNVSFSEFLGYLRQYKSLLTGVSSISLVANAIVFTIFINTRRDKTAKGVFIATLVYGITVLLIKLLS